MASGERAIRRMIENKHGPKANAMAEMQLKIGGRQSELFRQAFDWRITLFSLE